jgi:hypothetical protein
MKKLTAKSLTNLQEEKIILTIIKKTWPRAVSRKRC